MTRVDYAKIAVNYDNGENRLQIPVDSYLEAHIKSAKKVEYNVLDLACGTGNHLAVQAEAFKGRPINWFGLDNSEDMLGIAKKKVKDVSYIQHNADEGLPYESNYFDYVTNNFAFHHFRNKAFILDEIKRVLKDNGVLCVRNGAMEKIPGWWLYQYFPDARIEDLNRFWSTEILFYELEKRGFAVENRIDHSIKRVRLSEMYKRAINKDASEFALIADAHYQDGLKKMMFELDMNPGATTLTEFAVLVCMAKKKGDTNELSGL